ncbi:MAG: ABC transporter ATP-binding protein [bacterium]
MPVPIIEIAGVGKKYRIRGQRVRYLSLRDEIARRAASVFRPRSSAPGRKEDFWALRDISFSVNQGEAVGIIGRNGAGKSTLLKVLSQITPPTEGRVTMRGRVASLLEVGTGFHPELTGRENVFLNGAILGMTRAEVKRKFDEIVAFSEVEKFLDTPVKRYSSGMYVRLAFAVAAHLEPEILVVDEVLAVGDAAFQKKCLGKMGEVTRGGRTVLFVSHNLGSVQTLCSRGVLLHNGAIALLGGIEQTVASYLAGMEVKSSQELAGRTDRKGTGRARLVGLDIEAGISNPAALSTGGAARLAFRVSNVLPGMSLYFTIYNLRGHQVANFRSASPGPDDVLDPKLGTAIVCDIDELTLVPGRYRINAALLAGGETLDHVEAAAVFDVAAGVLRGRAVNGPLGHGDVCLPHRWSLPC